MNALFSWLVGRWGATTLQRDNGRLTSSTARHRNRKESNEEVRSDAKVLEKTEKEGHALGKNARSTLSKIGIVSSGVGRGRK